MYHKSDDSEEPDRLYSLFAIVVHIGGGPYQGHYITLIKSGSQWISFDDDIVQVHHLINRMDHSFLFL